MKQALIGVNLLSLCRTKYARHCERRTFFTSQLQDAFVPEWPWKIQVPQTSLR